MGVEMDLTAILRELIQFLECLRDAKLPSTLEKLRESLLQRSKSTLTTFATARESSTSPEPYLNMNAGPKSLFAITNECETDVQEYIDPEKPQNEVPQEYYETFQEVEPPKALIAEEDQKTKQTSIENDLINIYSSFSAAQTKNKCDKCGPLYRKEGKKLFVFEQYRACWVGLVGSHLLIYTNERDSRPCMVLSIRGYMGRPAPNIIPKDQRRSESAFEIFCPGNKTLQFIARTPKDMEQWVAKICELGTCDTEKQNSRITETNNAQTTETDFSKSPEQSKNANSQRSPESGQAKETKTEEESREGPSAKISSSTSSTPPPLPARIPRRLPSLPPEETITSYEFVEDEEDDIYYRIEDVKKGLKYENVEVSRKARKSNVEELPTYDDIHGHVIENNKNKARRVPETKGTESSENLVSETIEIDEIYDDVGTAARIKQSKKEENKVLAAQSLNELTSYDDVESLLATAKPARQQDLPEEPKKPTEGPSKSASASPQKKSFLDRVRNKKDSPSKTEKNAKRKTSTPTEELPVYDDVSDLILNQETSPQDENLPEYNFPPPPRPVYSKAPPADTNGFTEEFYDDVSECRERYKTQDSSSENQLKPQEEIEHYQSPRSNSMLVKQSVDQEELYDDIAILMDFSSRQRDQPSKRDGETVKANDTDKRPWNRFVSGRKSKAEPFTLESRSSNELEDLDYSEQQGLGRMNTFQKLINKFTGENVH